MGGTRSGRAGLPRPRSRGPPPGAGGGRGSGQAPRGLGGAHRAGPGQGRAPGDLRRPDRARHALRRRAHGPRALLRGRLARGGVGLAAGPRESATCWTRAWGSRGWWTRPSTGRASAIRPVARDWSWPWCTCSTRPRRRAGCGWRTTCCPAAAAPRGRTLWGEDVQDLVEVRKQRLVEGDVLGQLTQGRAMIETYAATGEYALLSAPDPPGARPERAAHARDRGTRARAPRAFRSGLRPGPGAGGRRAGRRHRAGAAPAPHADHDAPGGLRRPGGDGAVQRPGRGPGARRAGVPGLLAARGAVRRGGARPGPTRPTAPASWSASCRAWGRGPMPTTRTSCTSATTWPGRPSCAFSTAARA